LLSIRKDYLSAIALLISIVFVACSFNSQNSIEDYKDDDIAAIVKGKEITMDLET